MPATASPFSAFISHRYDSPDANLFFFDLCLANSGVQFEVDKGKFTSVTRIERAMRRAEAFLGIFSLPSQFVFSQTSLIEASRYLRFELDIAVRSGKPGLVFVDDRYGQIFPEIARMELCRFNFASLASGRFTPAAGKYTRAFDELVQRVLAKRQLELDFPLEDTRSWRDRYVGVFLTAKNGYPQPLQDEILSRLNDSGWAISQVRDPAGLDISNQNELRRLDWAIVDVGDPNSIPLAAYLQGLFVPMLRLRNTTPGSSGGSDQSFEASLFGSFETGYKKDVLVWQQETELLDGLDKRLTRIQEEPRLIATASEAEAYFRSAKPREEPVFLSYSGKDTDAGKAYAKALTRRFKTVFEYRQDGALTPSRKWMEELSEKLNNCRIGVALYSTSYFKSDYCTQEAATLSTRANSGDLALFGIRLEKDVQLLPYLTDFQNIRGWINPDPDDVVSEIIRVIETLPAGRPSLGK